MAAIRLELKYIMKIRLLNKIIDILKIKSTHV